MTAPAHFRPHGVTVAGAAAALFAHTAGDGPPIVLLHGFPEIGRYWFPVMARLAAGFRVIAPDLRGYGASGRPSDPDDYGIDALCADVAAVLDGLGLERAHIVGHDWGGVLAWWFAAASPARVRSLTAINAPHPVAFQRRLNSDPDQRRRSAYISLLQEPGAAARLQSLGADALWSRFRAAGDGFDEADRVSYLQAWSMADAWAGPVAWYRAAPFAIGAPLPAWAADDLPIEPPTLILWGARDETFTGDLVAESALFCASARTQLFADCRHNPPRERPDACAEAIAQFVSSIENGGSS